MKCTLKEILQYKHPAIIRRFKKEFPKKKEMAEVLFEDLMRFFWASAKHEEDKESQAGQEALDFVFIMDEEMRAIDDMWHIFLLYTKDYMDYCDDYFGEYIHHLPDIVPGMEQNAENFERNLRRFLNYTYDLLGEEVVCRWFSYEKEKELA